MSVTFKTLMERGDITDQELAWAAEDRGLEKASRSAANRWKAGNRRVPVEAVLGLHDLLTLRGVEHDLAELLELATRRKA